ncbi:unnamed protein product [Caenorhabditis bovis]|uniref:HTH OST-type domain-containing protein n=1 Tax=Caenorhabditis bovis TaxID=2654633 RepID=A0A8S1F7M6_9PELO|nr:unnamed protein product [Caenorhabditis bovis]
MSADVIKRRMNTDIYSVILPHCKDGLPFGKIVPKMLDSLGYSYDKRYHEAGFRDLADLLNQHPKITRLPNGNYTIIPDNTNEELVKMVVKQKDNKRKKKAVASKIHRPHTHIGFSLNYRSPKQQKSVTVKLNKRPILPTVQIRGQQPLQPNMDLNKPFMPKGKKANSPVNCKIDQKRKASSTKKITTHVYLGGDDAEDSRAVFAPTTKTDDFPSIVTFRNNTMKMLAKVYPKPMHLSELSDLYEEEFGLRVDPMQVFSKSWKMLATSTFKDFIGLSGAEIKLKEEWVNKNRKYYMLSPDCEVSRANCGTLKISDDSPNSESSSKRSIIDLSKQLGGLTVSSSTFSSPSTRSIVSTASNNTNREEQERARRRLLLEKRVSFDNVADTFGASLSTNRRPATSIEFFPRRAESSSTNAPKTKPLDSSGNLPLCTEVNKNAKSSKPNRTGLRLCRPVSSMAAPARPIMLAVQSLRTQQPFVRNAVVRTPDNKPEARLMVVNKKTPVTSNDNDLDDLPPMGT